MILEPILKKAPYGDPLADWPDTMIGIAESGAESLLSFAPRLRVEGAATTICGDIPCLPQLTGRMMADAPAGRPFSHRSPAQVSDDDERLAKGMCSDLSNGLSMFQMHSQAIEFYRDGRSEDAAQLAAAELEDLATREYCPEFRDAFEATNTYETWIEP